MSIEPTWGEALYMAMRRAKVSAPQAARIISEVWPGGIVDETIRKLHRYEEVPERPRARAYAALLLSVVAPRIGLTIEDFDLSEEDLPKHVNRNWLRGLANRKLTWFPETSTPKELVVIRHANRRKSVTGLSVGN